LSQSERTDSLPILRTKLHRPSITEDTVCRGSLHERMDLGMQTPLTLVSAPAGYGKSTLVSQWAEALEMPCAWISLDEADSDLVVFVSYVVAAVENMYPDACPETTALITAPRLPGISLLARYLTNELDDINASFVVVLDDYHRIAPQSEVHDLLSYLLEHPPRLSRLVIATRRDPPIQMASLRGGGRVTEIRLQDLRFTAAEISDLLQKSTGTKASEEALLNLQRQTEGWAVALRLVALHLRHLEDPEGFLRALRGGIQNVEDYLLQEVWSRRSPQMQSWLLQTSILERFCADLCDAVCAPDEASGSSDLDGRQFVEALQRTNLFAVSLDAHGEWFRYHHLFQAMLEEQLTLRASPEEIAGIHARASEWHEKHGDIEESIRHALAAGQVDDAAEIFERHRRAEQDADRWRVVERWLAMLPAEMRRQRPGLLLAEAWVLHDRFQLREIAPIVECVASIFGDETSDRVLLGELNFFQGVLLFWQGRGEECLNLMLEAREQIPQIHPRMTGLIEIYVGLARQMIGQEETAIRELTETDLGGHSRRPEFLSRVALGQALIHTVSGELGLAAMVSQRVEILSREIGIAYMIGWSHYLPACSKFRSNDLDSAMRLFARVVKRRYSTHTRAAVDSLAGLALTYQAMQRPDDANAMTQQLLEFALETGDTAHLAVARSAQARIFLAQGDIERATGWVQSFNDAPNPPGMLVWLENPAITQARVLVAIGTEASLLEAVELLDALRQATEALNNRCQTIEILALQSLAVEKQGLGDEALSVLGQALALGEPRGWIRPFAEPGPLMTVLLGRLPRGGAHDAYVVRILDALRDSDDVVSTGEVATEAQSASGLETPLVMDQNDLDALTNRELDVLELLAKRLQNKEIAARLCISTQTVGTHLKRIYEKLDVHDRRQAVQRAIEAGIIDRRPSG
jgi:ATP/maltotriose-dependent transcriptional regulator MalT